MDRFINGLLLLSGSLAVIPLLFLWSPYVTVAILLIGVAILKWKYPELKGAAGERYVNRLLNKLGEEYTVFDDLYVPNGDKGMTQVDHVVTSPYGIFVIETKHYDGWIFGGEKQQYWTQVIYQRKERLYNPIRQNAGHIQALRDFLGKEGKWFHSIIAFSRSSTLKFKQEFVAARVIQFPELVKIIREQGEARMINDSDLQEINHMLDGLVIQDKKEKRKVRKQHVAELKARQKEKARTEKDRLKQNLCPKCGGSLTRRKGKHGAFDGCSNFPKCRYTKKAS
ncbi:NERD domain-containing protein [Virgibacillus xinjiangensis]|uniref:NERD domain-containing protein n=1 Tax=Virgibacillus xinjiangensis TaxID=393090 RepID=A0ABV7CWP7_9BACI